MSIKAAIRDKPRKLSITVWVLTKSLVHGHTGAVTCSNFNHTSE
jgi:hypothetical protein